MTVSEKAAYFKGLVEGLGADRDSREGKLWLTLTDLLCDISGEIVELKDTSLDFADTLDEFSEDLSYLEEITCDLDRPEDFEHFGEFPGSPDEFCSGECASCGLCDEEEDDDPESTLVDFADYVADVAGADVPADAEDLPEADDELEYDGVVYDVICPTCGEEITFEEETLDEGFIICPNCGEKLEFDFSED